MKRLISIFMIVCMMNLLLIGCGEENQYPNQSMDNQVGAVSNSSRLVGEIELTTDFEKQYNAGLVNIVSITNDSITGDITVVMDVTQENIVHRRKLVFAQEKLEGYEGGISVQLLNENDGLLWGNELFYDLQNNTCKFAEMTSADTLRIEKTLGSRTHEKYSVGDQVVNVDYTEEEIELFRRTENPDSRQACLKAIPELREKIESLHEKADSLVAMTQIVPGLYENVDGELVSELTTDQAFADYLGSQIDPNYQPVDMSMEVFCALAALGTTFKCILGGPFNPVCIIGTGVTIFCALFVIAEWAYDSMDE